MRQEIKAGGALDLLTKGELDDSMGHHFNAAIRDLLRGVDYLQFAGIAGGVNTFSIPYTPESGYSWSLKLVTAQLSTPTVSSPSVPATGVAAENPNAFPVNVVINANGATISAVTVNGVIVGTSAGTYVVPADGSIAVSYTVATPTWVWSYAGSGTAFSVYSGSNNQVAPIGNAISQVNGTNNEAVVKWSSNQVVLKDGRQITLYCGAATIINYLIMVEQVPTEMQGKL